MTIAELYRRASRNFGELVRAVGPEQWTSTTPCDDWNVRQVVKHVVVQDIRTPPLLSGSSAEEAADRSAGDVLGADPAAAYAAAADRAVDAVSTPGALERTVHMAAGDIPGEEYAWQQFAEHLIHGWDLARAIGADDRLDPELVAACTEWFAEREEMYRSAGFIGPRPELPGDADPQSVLLAAFGRRAPVPAVDRET